jgi:hypothetical protein
MDAFRFVIPANPQSGSLYKAGIRDRNTDFYFIMIESGSYSEVSNY